MAKASPAQVSFNSGELSPMLDARTDYVKYSSGCSRLENFIPSVQGPARRRGGTVFLAETRNSSKAYLHRFEYSVDQAYVLEFTDLRLRFYIEGGRLESPPGTPVEVVTPYTAADLFAADGTCPLRFTQSGDFLYICHPSYAPRVLMRTSATTFTLTALVTQWGPFKDIVPDQTITVSASATSGAITLTASAALFVPSDVGTHFYLESRNVTTVQSWEPGKVIVATNMRRSDGKVYIALNGATTGANRPVHTHGAIYDGDGGVNWEFHDPGYGYVSITGYVSPTVVNATVLSPHRLPLDVTGANSTTRWAKAAWSASEGYPHDVTFFRERLWFARNQTLWASVSSSFDDFSRLNFGEVTDDMAIIVTLASATFNRVQWLVPDKELIIGTAGAEFALGEFSNGSPLAPGNVRVRQQSQFGSRSIVPVQAGSSVLFVQRSGSKAREIVYDEINGYQSADVTVDSEHIARGAPNGDGYVGLVDIDYAREPDPLVWAVRQDGRLVALTWDTEQRVRGWHRQPIGGAFARVESVAVIPGPDGDSVFLSVNRFLNGVTKRYVERLTNPFVAVRDASGVVLNKQYQIFSDSCKVVSSVPVFPNPAVPMTSAPGFDHLEGQTVDILGDGAPQPQRVVTGGAVVIDPPAVTVVVGLPAPCRLRTMRMEAGAADGTAQAKTKRMHKMGFRLLDAGGGKYGPDDDHMDVFQFGQGAPMNQSVPLFSGDKVVDWPKGYELEAYVQVTNDQPTAITVEAIYPQIVTQDAR